MSVISIFILYAHITAALGNADGNADANVDGNVDGNADGNVDGSIAVGTGLCTDDTPGEGGINGYEFLKKNTRFDLVMTSLKDVFTDPDGSSVKCITALTIEKDDVTHEVTETVSYKRDGSEEWEEFGQTFKFEQSDSGAQYVKMNNMEMSGAPSGTYTFSYVMGDCAVVHVEGFGNRLSENEPQETAQPEQRTDTSDDSSKPHCIMWEKHGTSHATQKCCEKHFSAHCKAKNSAYEYNPNKCGTPPVGRTEL
ncbi:uncharacterized protein LOC142563765 [Dermacentor variabilis]|uniref:uncharacterized protein LOC142563765 n=1 Tax=Dermacentor variabilis TaxID=34621 RepID=UPI003F5C1148